MSKTFRRNSAFRPKKHGRVFVKDQPWKKNKHSYFPELNRISNEAKEKLIEGIDPSQPDNL